MEPIAAFIGLALIGLIIGVISGLFGIGGGTIIVPTLRLGLGLDAYSATATSLFSMIFTSTSSTASHAQQKTLVPKLGLALGLGGCITSALGVYLGSVSPSWAIMLVAALIIGYSAFSMLRKALSLPKPAERLRAANVTGSASSSGKPAVSSSIAEEEFSLAPRKLAGGFCIGLLAGVCAGYVGVGGGFIMVPLMTAWLGVPMRMASGTSSLAIVILAIPGIVEQGFLGNIDYITGVAVAVGSIPGAVLGARLVKRIPERKMRFMFAGLLAVAAVALVINEVGTF